MQIRLTDIDEPAAPIRASIDEDALHELADSIRRLGLLQPIGVRRQCNGRFTIVYGHRRYLAHNILARTHIDVITMPDENTALDSTRKLVENTQREPMTPIEEAYAVAAMMLEPGANVSIVARLLGKPPQWCRQRMRLIELPEEIQEAIHDRKLTLAVATHLGAIQDPDTRAFYVANAIQNGCTETVAAIWASQAIAAANGTVPAPRTQAELDELESEPAHVDQIYTCFVCRAPFSWRRINLHVLCGGCQDAIATSAANPAIGVGHAGLDSDTETR